MNWSLPIETILPGLRSALRENRSVVLSAEPGAGKTTRVPVALLDEGWLEGRKVVMLEPRRLAAQRAAAFMAEQRHEKTGDTIGYRIRGETRAGPSTRVEVVTEGILTRMMHDDPAMPGVGLIIFDEFHERSIHADLGLALTRDVQEHLRNDLRILVMSATLEDTRIASLLGGVPVLQSEGRTYPVETYYAQHEREGRTEPIVAAAVQRVSGRETGDMLVFLPGQREIRRVAELLSDADLPADVDVHMLFGDAAPDRQEAALMPAPPGRRKVILSTNIAETSLTIDGVRVVIDSGLVRVARFDPRRGMSGLVTVPVSQAGADQRRGRAGRQEPGACYRLWTAKQERPRFLPPEILVSDLAPLALDLARWGDPMAEHLAFLDPPPAAHLAQARTLLSRLGALNAAGDLTAHGRAMADLPVHPRFAHMMLRGKTLGFGSLACDVAALLDERDLLIGTRDTDIDLASRWHLLRSGRDSFPVRRARKQAARLKQLLDAGDVAGPEEKLGILLALAYPERIAKRREEQGVRYRLAGGTGAILPGGSLMAREVFLAVGEVDGAGSEARIRLAAPITREEIVQASGDTLSVREEVRWDDRTDTIVACRVTRLDALDLAEASFTPGAELLRSTLLEMIRRKGLDILPWTKDALSVRARSEWLRLRSIVGTGWPDVSDEHLLETLESWLAPFVDGIHTLTGLQKVDTGKALRAIFSYDQLRLLDRLAPTHLTVPTGSRIPLDYTADPPLMAVRLQEMFGETETPAIAGGEVKVLLHLLSPAHRPLAVTQDLPSFWKNAYPEVRKDMRGRYPKHFWPENPLKAEPTKRSKRRR